MEDGARAKLSIKYYVWVRVLDIPLQFRAAQIFQIVGEAIGQVQVQWISLKEGYVWRLMGLIRWCGDVEILGGFEV